MGAALDVLWKSDASSTRTRDSWLFTLGVLNTGTTLFIWMRFPQWFHLWYSLWAAILLTWRYITYRRQKYHYFMLDFCYFVNALCVVHKYLLPDSHAIFSLAFVCACGPVAWGIVSWRNSLVFHDIDKMTSVFIHIMPPMLMYVQRWDPVSKDAPHLRCSVDPSVEDGTAKASSPADLCGITFWDMCLAYFVFYASWQLFYLVQTEIVDRRKLRQDTSIITSLRWLTGEKGTFQGSILTVCRKLSIMGKAERFQSERLKTKCVFVGVQLVYMIVTLLPTKLVWHYENVHFGFIVLLVVAAVHNGSDFYIHVFSKRYARELAARSQAAGSAQVEASDSDGSQEARTEATLEHAATAGSGDCAVVSSIDGCNVVEQGSTAISNGTTKRKRASITMSKRPNRGAATSR